MRKLSSTLMKKLSRVAIANNLRLTNLYDWNAACSMAKQECINEGLSGTAEVFEKAKHSEESWTKKLKQERKELAREVKE